jgi:vacuolar-type H+-ATPase subunit H
LDLPFRITTDFQKRANLDKIFDKIIRVRIPCTLLGKLCNSWYQNISLSFDTWKKMMDEQNRIINEAFRSQSQMLNDAIKEFSQNNPRMISNAIRQQAEIFNQIIQQQSRIFADTMKQFDEKKTKALQDGTDQFSNMNSERRQKKKK